MELATPVPEDEEDGGPYKSEMSSTKVSFFAELERIKEALVENQELVPEDQREQFRQLLDDNLNEEVIEAGIMQQRREKVNLKKSKTKVKK
mmetsp:Transcript_68501/g.94893  ORF Transcript_68501/g.94893 Transcript_68501/m.94893 type:complete len:91 (+) Transcript_68501:649-921(+)